MNPVASGSYTYQMLMSSFKSSVVTTPVCSLFVDENPSKTTAMNKFNIII